MDRVLERHHRRNTQSQGRRRSLCLGLAALLAWAPGCNAPQDQALSGFIADPPPLVRSPRVPTARVWSYAGKRISDYYKYIIDPVAVLAHPGEEKNIAQADLDNLATYFHEQMVRDLLESGKYQIVKQPGQGVLRVRTAITHVRPNKPIPGARITGIGLGSASLEAEIIDTGDQQRILVAVDTQQSNPFSLETTTRLGSAEEIVRHWAQLLREAADNRWISGDAVP